MAGAEVSNDEKYTKTHTCHLKSYDSPLIQLCRQILQSPDPRASFFKARRTELWVVAKESAGAKTAVVLTGSELVSTGHT